MKLVDNTQINRLFPQITDFSILYGKI